MPLTLTDRYKGCLIGTAVGDSLLLPAEGLTRQRIARRFGDTLRHGFFLGRGMISDDTDHTFLLARCLAVHRDDPVRCMRRFAWRLRWWLLCVPAGCGKATGRAIIKLLLGWSPLRSGVISGGNGPSMRAAIIGVVHAHNQTQRRAFGDAACHITHRHPHAHAAALAVAEVAAWIVRGDTEELWPLLAYPDPEWERALHIVRAWYERDDDITALAADLGCPDFVSGWSLHSVPFALGCWLRHRHDARAGLTAIRAQGGDTDTIGAIAGAWYGVDDGEAAFPTEWIDGIRDWPVSTSALRAVGEQLGGASKQHWAWPLLPVRNLFFFVIILAHVARRCFP